MAKEKLKKNQKGITLIALIITIIVMIILVAVTVNVAINGGLFGTASTASQRTERDALYDQIVGAMKLTGEGKIDKTGTYNAVEEILEGQGRTVEPLQEDGTFEVIGTRGTYTYKITEEEIIKGEITGEGSGVGPESGTGNGGTIVPNPDGGNGSGEGGGEPEGGDVVTPPAELPPIEESELLQSKYTQTIGTKKITVPEGFVVIDTTGTTENILEQANYETYIAANIENGIVISDKNRNEFVWIPVPEINDMIMCQSAETIPEGAEEGITGTCTIALEGETLKCTKHNSQALAGRLYADATISSYGENFNANLSGQTYNPTDGYREPTVLSFDDTQDKFTQNGGGTYSDTMYQTEFNEMATSVAKNGGFYVGRYETGGFNETKVVSKPDRGMNGEGDINYTTWYKMYQMQKDFGNDVVGSSMIWGCQHDQVMKFVNGKNNFSVTTPNGSRHSGSYTTGTGNTPEDFVANIYDLEGNMNEWTLEAFNLNRVFRGGHTNGGDSASFRQVRALGFGEIGGGSRLTLYVK